MCSHKYINDWWDIHVPYSYHKIFNNMKRLKSTHIYNKKEKKKEEVRKKKQEVKAIFVHKLINIVGPK